MTLVNRAMRSLKRHSKSGYPFWVGPGACNFSGYLQRKEKMMEKKKKAVSCGVDSGHNGCR